MKKFSILSLFFGMTLIFSFGAGCKKAEQPVEAPKPTEQARALAPVEGFKVSGGTLEKGGLGYVLSSNKDKTAVALKKTNMPFKNMVKIKGQIKAALPSGIRNGFIVFGEKPEKLANAIIFIGAKSLVIQGPFVQKVEKPQNFDQSKVFDTELIINLSEKTVTWKVDGTEIKTRMKSRPASINYVGYSVWSTKTEFSELQIFGK